MNVPALIAQLQRHEGLRLKPYTDTVGKLSIGVGRNLTDRGISEAEAGVLLANDIEIVRIELSNAAPWWLRLDDVRQRVLADMAFNLGVPVLLTFSVMLAAVKRGDFALASAEMLRSRWAEQVGERAQRLARMMRTGRDEA